MKLATLFTLAFCALGLAVLASTPARAGCLPGIGCTQGQVLPYPVLYSTTCGDLWYLRNSAFHDNGYCFKTTRAQRVFSNAGCVYRNAGDVPMSRVERTNVQRIREVERQNGCR